MWRETYGHEVEVDFSEEFPLYFGGQDDDFAVVADESFEGFVAVSCVCMLKESGVVDLAIAVGGIPTQFCSFLCVVLWIGRSIVTLLQICHGVSICARVANRTIAN
jgi:hypothetical protein